VDALEAWLNATPGEGRHLGRIGKLDRLDELASKEER
jgi:hypothetical protein